MYKIVSGIAFVFFAFILWIIYLANTGQNSIFFDFVRGIPNGDKLGHSGIFGFLTFIAVIASKFRVFTIAKFKLYVGAVFVIIFVILEETTQAFIPSRTFDLKDLAADSIGISLAVALAYISNRYLFKKQP